jgi:GABA permease
MPFKNHILVLANRTVDAEPLLSELENRAQEGPIDVTLLVPASREERAEARERMEAAIARLTQAGIDAEGRLGPAEPLTAISEEYDNARYDEVIVSTLAEGASRWLAQGLPGRVQRLTGAVVHHVTSPAREHSLAGAAAEGPPRERHPVFEGMLHSLRANTNDVGHPYG